MAHILIAGGGIGGLAAALAIAQRGHTVDVFERNPDFAELGAGIQLAPNAFHALELLGVRDEVLRKAVHVEALCLRDGVTGRSLAELPLGASYRERFGNPYAVVHRGDLYAPLLAACRERELIRLHADCE